MTNEQLQAILTELRALRQEVAELKKGEFTISGSKMVDLMGFKKSIQMDRLGLEPQKHT